MIRLLIFLAVILTACSMEKRSKELADTSSRIEEQSKMLGIATCKVTRLGAKGGSYDHVNDAIDLEALFNPNVRGAEKLSYAHVVFEAMPFQMWDGACGDTDERLEFYYERSIHLLFSRIHDHIDDSLPVDTKTADPLADNEWSALAALGATMDELDIDYKAAMKEHKKPALSVYDLIVSGLAMESAYERGEKIPAYAVEVLRWKPEMIYLLQLRHNFLVGMILVAATDIEDSFKSEAKMLVYERSVPLYDKVHSSMARVSEYHTWLKKAERTRNDLKQLGHDIEVNWKFAVAAAHTKWVPHPQASGAVATLQQDFIKTYSALVAENAPLVAPKIPRAVTKAQDWLNWKWDSDPSEPEFPEEEPPALSIPWF